jgi:PAS domain S-box-containing protein
MFTLDRLRVPMMKPMLATMLEATVSSLSETRLAPACGESAGPTPVLADPASFAHLTELVHHHQRIDVGTPLAEVQRLFQGSQVDYIAIAEQERIVGLCSRATVGIMLGSRYGFALYGNSSVWTARVPRPLMYTPGNSSDQIMAEAFSRTGSEFFEDVILLHPDRTLLGLVPVPALARLQMRRFSDQLDRIVTQDEELRQQNLDMFQVNHQLRQSQGRSKTLFENNALGVALLDKQGTVIAHNRRFTQMLRLTEQMAVEGCLKLESLVTEAERPRLRRLLSEHESRSPEPEPRLTEMHFTVTGIMRNFELHTSWVAETGQICVFLADITDQRLLEQQAARQDKQNMLDTLVAGVAHELNNKLTPVLGFAEMLQADAPESLRLYTRCISQCSQEAAKIIRQLLSLSRPEGLVQDQLDLTQVCQDALQMLCFQLREAGCEVDLQLPSAPARVRGDAAQLKQVLINLMLNSLHAMEHLPIPRLQLTVRVDRGFAFLEVGDIGRGIRPEHLERIFDPFFTTKGPKGTGLGLSISASIIRQHGGEISADSPPGSGAVFTIRLPLSDAPTQSQPQEAVPPLHRAPVGINRKRVLVVDDEEFVRQFMQEALRLCFGCSVDTAADGLEAVSRVETGSYQLIVSDIRMPRMDGLDFLAWLQEHQPDLVQRLVFVTGHAGTMEADHRLSRLPCPVVRKTFTVEAIRDACSTIL